MTRARLRGSRRFVAFLSDDLGAELNAFVADRDRRRRTANDSLNVGVRLAAERATKRVEIDSSPGRLGFGLACWILVRDDLDASPVVAPAECSRVDCTVAGDVLLILLPCCRQHRIAISS